MNERVLSSWCKAKPLWRVVRLLLEWKVSPLKKKNSAAPVGKQNTKICYQASRQGLNYNRQCSCFWVSIRCNDLPDITEGIDGDPQLQMYTDDTTVYVSAPTFDLVASKLNEVLARLYTWCCENCLTPHPTKTESMLLSGRGQLTGPKNVIKLGDYGIEKVVSTRCLDVQINNALAWDHHVSKLTWSFKQKLNLLKLLSAQTGQNWFLFWGYFALCYVWHVGLGILWSRAFLRTGIYTCQSGKNNI